MKTTIDEFAEYAVPMAKNAATMMFGGWNMYWSYSNIPHIDLSVESTLAPAVGIGTAAAVAWNYVTDSKISNTTVGAAALTAIATLPAAFSYLMHLNEDRSDKQNLALAIGASAAAAGAVALARFSEILNTNTDVADLAATVTFPAAYLFFKFPKYGQQQGQALASAAVISYAVGGVASLMATPRP